MPLPKRIIYPVHVTRNTLPGTNVPGITITSELEAVANGALANIIRQLSSLSQHAENMFVELSVIATGMFERTASLQTRVDRLSMKVTALDSNVEEVSLQDIHMRKAFKSAVIIDQQLFAKTSLPDSIRSVYEQCDEPPPLNLLNCYRDDGKDGLKFYTDPNYFFELWGREMINDTERMMHDKSKRFRPKHMLTSTSTLTSNEVRHKKRVRQPHNTRERQKQIAMTQGEYIMSSATIGQQQYATTMQHQKNQSQAQQALYYATLRNSSNNIRTLMRPSSIEVQQQYIYGNHTNSDDLDSSLSLLNLSNHSDHYHRPHNHDDYVYNHNHNHSQEPIYGSSQLLSPSRRVRPSQPPPAPPPNQQQQEQSELPPPPHTQHTSNSTTPNKTHQYSTPNINRGNLPPPPPPPPALFAETQSELSNDSNSYYYDDNDKVIADNTNGTKTTSPPPPPPPPPMPMPIDNNVSSGILRGGGSVKHEHVAPLSKITNGDLLKTISTLSPPKLKPVTNSIMAPEPDPRNELLQAIRSGIKLRKVEKNEQKSASINATNNGLHDVASILSRRVAVEYSDSDTSTSQNDDDSEYDSDCWAVGDSRQQRNSVPATSGGTQPKESQQQQQPQSVSQIIT